MEPHKIIGKVWYLPRILSSTSFCWGRPVVVYVTKQQANWVWGALTEEAAEAGELRLFELSRCLPYDENRNDCERQLRERRDVDADYISLVKRAAEYSFTKFDGEA